MSTQKEDFKRKYDYLLGTKSLLESYVSSVGADATGTFRSTVEEAGRLIKNLTFSEEDVTITENGVTETPDNIRYKKIIVDVALPALNTPIVSLDINGYVNVADYRNGNFTDEFLLYVNGEQIASFTGRQIAIMDYNIGVDDEITVIAQGEGFYNSPPTSPLKYSDISNGTIGLVYSMWNGGMSWSGVGNITETDITVGSKAEGKTVVNVAPSTLELNNTKMVVRLPDTITKIGTKFLYGASNKVIVFGANTEHIGEYAFYSGNYTTVILDFRKAKKVPVYAGGFFGNNPQYHLATIVPYDLLDEWENTQNWMAATDRIFTEEEYITKYGPITWDL